MPTTPDKVIYIDRQSFVALYDRDLSRGEQAEADKYARAELKNNPLTKVAFHVSGLGEEKTTFVIAYICAEP